MLCVTVYMYTTLSIQRNTIYENKACLIEWIDIPLQDPFMKSNIHEQNKSIIKCINLKKNEKYKDIHVKTIPEWT